MSFQFNPTNVQKLGMSAISCLLLAGSLTSSIAFAQDKNDEAVAPPEKILEEIVVEGQKSWEGHDGMEAFWAGDYEKAEIEFEREFKSLKRARSARYNAASEAAINIDRANNLAANSGAGGQLNSGGPSSGQAPGNASSPLTSTSGSNFKNKRAKGKNLLNDGKVTDQDFALTKYMSGLSEIQLGKYTEAKKSIKSSIFYDSRNHDARMRLGLLYLIEGNIDKSADQLEALEKIRVNCKKKQCSEYNEIVTSASTLAKSITNAINKLKGK